MSYLKMPCGVWAGLVVMTGGAAAADRVVPVFAEQPVSGWTVTIGANGKFGPRYIGSDKMGFSGSPSLSWRRAGEPLSFSAPDDGFGLALYKTSVFSVGPVGAFKSGRYFGDDRRLFGLRDVPWTIEGGAFVEFWPIQDRLRTRLEVRQGFHGHRGVVADASVDWVERFGAFTLSGGLRLSLANGSYMDRNFGVSPGEAALNGTLTPYRAKGGLRSVGAGAALDYRWTPAWTTRTFVKYDRLIGSADDSPIVRLGDRNQFTVGVGASYTFAWGQ